MISTISFPKIKQLLFFILLLKVHAQPPLSSLNHQVTNELQHHQQHQHHQKQEPQYQHRQQQRQQQQQGQTQKHIFNLPDLTEKRHSKELKGRTRKNSSLPLITFNLKYPLDYENFNSERFHHLSKNHNKKNSILNDQYKINQKNKQKASLSSSSLKSSNTNPTSKEETTSKIKTNKQLKHSHQQKREVILADVPLWSLQFATTASTSPNIDSKYNKNETPLFPLPNSKLEYTYNKKPIEDPDITVSNDENFTSTEISENEINKIFSPNELEYIKEYQKQKRRPPFSTRRFSKLLEKPTNKLLIGLNDGDDDGGGDIDDGGGGGRNKDGNDDDVNTDESNNGHKKIKFYLNSYPFQGERLNVKNKIRSNLNNNGDDSEDYDGNNNYGKTNKNYNNKYFNDLNDADIEDFQDIFHKRITAPPVWMKMLRNRKDGRKPWALVDRKQEIGGGGGGITTSGGISRIQFFNEPNSKSHNPDGFTRQKLKTHQTQFVPSVSVGAMTNLGDFFDKLKNNVDFMEKNNLNPDAIDLMEGDHLSKISDNIKSEVMDSGGQTKPTGTAAFLHAIRTYRPSQKVRALVSMTPEGYHGHGTHFSDPNYMWIGLGK